MSRTYEEKTVPERKYTFLAQVECDICHRVVDGHREWKKEGFYDATKTEVTLITGDRYPEGGSGETTTIDICPECFVDKLIPWVESHGGKPAVKEWEN